MMLWLANESMGRAGGSKPQPYICSKAVSPWNQAKHSQRVHTGGEGEDGKVWHWKWPIQGYETLKLLSAFKWQADMQHVVFFWLRDQIAKFKTRQT